MSRDSARRYLVAYDIPDDRRRTRVAKHLGTYGDRLQYSVFLIELKPARFLTLRSRLEQLTEADLDSLLICDLGLCSGPDRSFFFLGRDRPTTPSSSIII